MVEIWESILLVILGFTLGFLGWLVQFWLSKWRERRKMAAVLGSEIQAIEATAKHSLEVNMPSLEEVRRKSRKEPNSQSHIEIADADFPTDVYYKILSNIGLFNLDQIVILTELYRWIEYAHHWKQENLQQAADLNRFLSTILGKTFTSNELNYLRMKAVGCIHYATVYLQIVENIASLATQTLNELTKIRRIEAKYKVNVKLREILREKYP
ncbi:MAG: hypothetical protein ACFFC7_28860 [Candidatus Hermodarchaeota archaeon]